MSIGRIVNRLLGPLGLELRRRGTDAECFGGSLRQAREAGMDVNDWLEERMGWEPALPVLEAVLFPHLDPSATVVELGPGTGRQSRHIAPRVPDGELILVDRGAWATDFLRGYFAGRGNVRVLRGDGLSLPVGDAEADVIYCDGTFIYLNPGVVMAYAREFARVLRPGGLAVFDWIDPGTGEGHAFLDAASRGREAGYYTCYPAGLMDGFFTAAGLVLEGTAQMGKSTYARYRRPEGGAGEGGDAG